MTFQTVGLVQDILSTPTLDISIAPLAPMNPFTDASLHSVSLSLIMPQNNTLEKRQCIEELVVGKLNTHMKKMEA